MSWTIKNHLPIHNQLIEELELRIVMGVYPIGTRLPSVRDLALEARVNPNTMQKALVELEEKGLIYTERTNGKFVADNKELIKFAKQKMANELVDDFIFNMKNLGFDQETILSYLKERMEK